MQKSETGAPGGAFGIGKNAVFNVSDIQTVFYSTHYVDIKNRKGRVDKLQGKSTLMSHPNPDNPNESLQHIGFYQNDSGQSINGRRKIADFFRLAEPGAGVFIMGFNPRTDNWVDEIIRAVLQNFFYAIHDQRLVVNIDDGKNATKITHEELEPLFERYGDSVSNSRLYYRAILEEPENTKPIKDLGDFDVYIHIANGGPKRMAFVNRNGMLISDSREKKDNPIPPRNRNLWHDYAAVIIPSTDSADKLIRRMENPSHDSISVNQLRDPAEKRRIDKAILAARDAIRDIMNQKVLLDQSGQQANLRELAAMFPELDPANEGVTPLVTREVIRNTRNQDSFVAQSSEDDDNDGSQEINEDISGEHAGGPEGEQEGEGGGKSERDGTKGSVRGEGSYGTRGRRTRLKQVRVLTTAAQTVVVSFTPTGASPHQVRFALKAAGEEYDKNVSRISIASVHLIDAKAGQSVSVNKNIITLSAPETERAFMKIETSDSVANAAFKLEVVR